MARQAITADEFVSDDGQQTIETFTVDAASDVIKFEAFMNEEISLMVHESADENDLPIIVVNVNGTNQPILRGHEQKIKRKYVEALARAKTTKYHQRVLDPREPDKIENVPKVVLSYPFNVIEDSNPKGAPWLKSILADRQI